MAVEEERGVRRATAVGSLRSFARLVGHALSLMLLGPEKVGSEARQSSQQRIEGFEIRGNRLVRRVLSRHGKRIDTDVGLAPSKGKTPAALHAIADLRYLRSKESPGNIQDGASITIADLFGGLGALSLGAIEAARVLGLPAKLVLAVDKDPAPLKVLRQTLGVDNLVARQMDLSKALRAGRGKQTKGESALLRGLPRELDILVAGPPCQGHSRLNNHTRHNDPRNDLYGRVVRFAELRRPRLCIIENVDSVVNDQRESAFRAADNLEALGYQVDEGRVSLHELGVPQCRRRHLLVATDQGEQVLDVEKVIDSYAVEDPQKRHLRWAIGDLEGKCEITGFDASAAPSEENKTRMRWLHEKPNRYDLPNPQRPDCHKDIDKNGKERKHSYRSMYGKLNWEKPAQTITSGYGSMGQGRYVHPSEERTLTPHEAARLQFIPDFVRFDAVSRRGEWARMIGNVAPMKLSYVFVLEFLR